MDRKIVASHQPHFFPWLGYLDKMAKADLFIINDVAQLEKKSPMVRNKILDCRGLPRFIYVSVEKEDWLKKPNGELRLQDWEGVRTTLKNVLIDAYRKSPYFSEIFPILEEMLSADFTTLLEVDMATITLLRKCFCIDTPLIFNSSIVCDHGTDKSERIANKVAAVGGTIYLSGNGAKKYMDLSAFETKRIDVVYQQFEYPEYPQYCASVFFPNLSALDLLFNCGIQQSQKIFWSNVERVNEIQII